MDFYIGEPIQIGAIGKKWGEKIPNQNPASKASVRKLLKIDISVGFKNRHEYCDYIVTAAHAFAGPVRKKTRSGRTIGELLCASCNPETIGWHIDNERIRKEIDPSILEYMEAGATGSEALNAELGHWFFGIKRLHAPAMRLKIRVFHMWKLLTF